MIPRLHLIELHEQPYCPVFIRRYVQDILRFMWENTGMVQGVVPLLGEALKSTGSTHIYDLCSGGGGPHKALLPELQKYVLAGEGGKKKIQMTLTDLYPHVSAWEEISAGNPNITYRSKSVDATNVPPDLKGFRTLFTCLHHFQPALVQGILQDAVNKGEGIAMFELTQRDFLSIFSLIFVTPLATLSFAVLKRPFSLVNLFLTLFFPIAPSVAMIDGIVSDLRTYTVEEMQKLIDQKIKGQEGYDWKLGYRQLSPNLPAFLTAPYLIGVPKKKTS